MNFSLIFILTIIQLGLFVFIFRLKLKRNQYFLIGMISFFVFHLFPMIFFNEIEADILAFRDSSRALFLGKDIYDPSVRMIFFPQVLSASPYFPFWIYFIGFADLLASRLAIPFAAVFKMPQVLANLGIALLFLKSSKIFGISQENKRKFFALYLLNPLPTLIASYQGHWDSVVLFLLILGLLLFSRNKKIVSALIISIATLIKPWPIVFLPLFLLRIKGNLNRLKFVSIYLTPLLLSIMIYSLFVSTSFTRIIGAVFFYQSLAGWWGISLLIFIVRKRWFSFWNPQIFLEVDKWLLGGILIFISFFRKTNLVASILLITLVVYVLTPGFSIHYLVWIIPLALLNKNITHYFSYSILAGIFLLFTFTFMVFPDNRPFILSQYLTGLTINLLALSVWGYCLYWLFDLLKGKLHEQI